MEVVALLAIFALLFSRKGETAVSNPKDVINSQVKSPVPPIVGTEAWRRYDAIFRRYATSYGIDWTWLKAFSLNESLLGTDARTSKGEVSSDGLSWGIMQVTLSTAIALGAGPIQGPALNNPDLSVSLAAKLVAQLQKQFSGNLEAIVMSYNEGSGNYSKGKRVPEYWERWKRWHKIVLENI
jgi:soluble lytic murein transglycosylase-like protein